MPFFDLPQHELENYQSSTTEPADFDQFWTSTLETTRKYPLNAEFIAVDEGLHLLEVFDVTFAGYGGQPIKGWFMVPRDTTEPLPCIVEYIGYGGGRGYPQNWLLWPTAGYAYLVMDTRGQGGGWIHGDTPDMNDGDSPSAPSFMTRGILNRDSYYYRRVFVDAVRAVEAAASHDLVDQNRIGVFGRSQGGGMAIAVAGLMPDMVKLMMPCVPFLCDFRRAFQLPVGEPYKDVMDYLRYHRHREQEILLTLNYFDGVHFASRARADALFSVALMDTICPPSTVYGAFNRLSGHHEMRIYPYNEHEGGQLHHQREMLVFVHKRWGH